MIMWGRVQKPLEGLDDASRVIAVIAHQHVSDGLIFRQQHGNDLNEIPQVMAGCIPTPKQKQAA